MASRRYCSRFHLLVKSISGSNLPLSSTRSTQSTRRGVVCFAFSALSAFNGADCGGFVEGIDPGARCSEFLQFSARSTARSGVRALPSGSWPRLAAADYTAQAMSRSRCSKISPVGEIHQWFKPAVERAPCGRRRCTQTGFGFPSIDALLSMFAARGFVRAGNDWDCQGRRTRDTTKRVVDHRRRYEPAPVYI